MTGADLVGQERPPRPSGPEMPQDMNSDYPNTQEAVNEQEQPKPGYYAIIPASVRYCSDLPAAAKLLFGELVALTSTSGYCYAQNPYFQGLYGVDRSTIKRWLAALADKGFISIQHDQATNERRIFVLAMLPGGVGQKRATPGAKTGHPRRKNEPQSITLSNTANTTRTLNVGDKPAEVPAPPQKEEKGSASPPPLTSWKSVKVDELVSLTGDTKSVLRFRQLLDIVEEHGCGEVWDNALDALRTAQQASTGRVERPGAYFCSIVVAALSERQVYVPVASSKERNGIRSQIAASLAAGSEVSK